MRREQLACWPLREAPTNRAESLSRWCPWASCFQLADCIYDPDFLAAEVDCNLVSFDRFAKIVFNSWSLTEVAERKKTPYGLRNPQG